LIFDGTRFGGTKAPQLGLPNMSGLEPSKWKSGGDALGTLKIVLFSHHTLGCVLGIIEWLPVVFSTEFMSKPWSITVRWLCRFRTQPWLKIAFQSMESPWCSINTWERNTCKVHGLVNSRAAANNVLLVCIITRAG